MKQALPMAEDIKPINVRMNTNFKYTTNLLSPMNRPEHHEYR